MEDINVQIIDMDVMIPEQVVKNHDGSYTIFLNARYTHEYNMKSYQHAIEHINNGDFDRDCGDVQIIEAAAHEDVLIEVVSESTPAVVTDSIISIVETVKKPVRRRRRRRNHKKDEELRERMEFLLEHCDMFARAENRYLYGNDL